MRYLIGFFEKEIPLQNGQWMGGYLPMRQATGVLDPLFIKGTVFFEEETKTAFAFLSFDLVAVDAALVQAIKQSFKEHSNWHSHVFLLATHTHSGPAGTVDTRIPHKEELISIFGAWDKHLVSELTSRSVEGLIEALQTRESFQYRKGMSEAKGIQTDRNDPDAPGFDVLGILEFKTASDKRALLWHFSCHPTILKENNTLFSADLPGAVSRRLSYYGHVQYVNGAAGNLSTRFTRGESTPAEVERMGSQLAEAFSTTPLSNWNELETLQVKSNTFFGKQKERAELLPLPYWFIHFDGSTFLTIPGELTSAWSKDFLEQNVWVLGYCNGYEFYFADSACYDQNTYEAIHSFLEPFETEKWMAEVGEQLKKREA